MTRQSIAVIGAGQMIDEPVDECGRVLRNVSDQPRDGTTQIGNQVTVESHLPYGFRTVDQSSVEVALNSLNEALRTGRWDAAMDKNRRHVPARPLLIHNVLEIRQAEPTEGIEHCLSGTLRAVLHAQMGPEPMALISLSSSHGCIGHPRRCKRVAKSCEITTVDVVARFLLCGI